MSDLFYVLGGALVAIALVLSFVGLRVEGFPRSRGVLVGGIAVTALLVIGTSAFAVVLAREEADHREHELAEAEAEGAAEQPSQGAGDGGEEADPETEAKTGPEADADAEVLELTSPQDGALVFEPDELSASAGQIQIDYTNPSAVPHDVAIEDRDETVGQGEVVTDGDVSVASAALEAGDYVFYCSVPGHREAGMEGTLTLE